MIIFRIQNLTWRVFVSLVGRQVLGEMRLEAQLHNLGRQSQAAMLGKLLEPAARTCGAALQPGAPLEVS